ncbi:diaminopimelate decarboxylase family protein [Bifidobacterium magnum]|uniref:Diaminopimelate decarboxylase n=1 Tax=Bifidobacterium magnum TaxID=1692 RepID=A0A087BEX0_9BIFI|nr:diaminopimelate decarboxylase [Bifidobacterium magnum]KFI69570.1 Diaminopimelate decarboxylase [Bifidobacterium magnum]
MSTNIWPCDTRRDADGNLTFHGITARELLAQFGSPLYVIDVDDVRSRARKFVHTAATAFPNTTTHVSFAAKAFLSKEIARIVSDEGMLIDTCTLGEMKIALAAGIPGRHLVLHGNNKSDEEIELAIREHFNKIVIDEPQEPARIAAIAERLGMRARVMVRVTSGIHAGGHEFVSTAHEDQKFGIALLPINSPGENDTEEPFSTIFSADHGGSSIDEDGTRDEAHLRALMTVMDTVAHGPAMDVIRTVRGFDAQLELVGVHSHIGSNIHDADAFIQAAQRMMLLRKTCYATEGYVLPEVDLGGGYSVAYTEHEDSMDLAVELGRLADAITSANAVLGMPMPSISFEPGRWIIAPTGVTLYTVGTVKPVALSNAMDSSGNPIIQRLYVSVDGGMSDNIRPALYGSEYAAVLANREYSGPCEVARVVGKHCESGDIVVQDVELPADIHRGDILAVPVTGAYGRTMASNYNQALIPAVVAVGNKGAHLMMRRQTIDDLLSYDVSE